MDLPVTTTAIVVTGIAPLPWVRRIPRREVPWWTVVRSAVGIRVWGRWVVAAVGVIVTAAGWAVLFHRATGRRSVARGTIVVVVATRAAVSVVRLAPGAVSASWWAAAVVFERGHVGTASARRARAAPFALRNVGLSLQIAAVRFDCARWGSWTHISNTLHAAALELAAIELLHSSLQVGTRLKLDESDVLLDNGVSLAQSHAREAYPRPLESRLVSEYTTSRLD